MAAASQLARQGDFEGAFAQAEKLKNQDASGVLINSFLAMIAVRQGRHTVAIEHFRLALKAAPEDISLRANLVAALTESGELQAALEVCDARTALEDKTMRLMRMRAYLLLSAESWADAAQAYESIVGAFPDDFDSWNNLGNARAQLNELHAAIAALEKAVSLRADSAPARLNLAAAYSDSGDHDAAMRALERASHDFPEDIIILGEYATLLELSSRFDEALAVRQQVLALRPQDVELHNAVGACQVARHSYHEARQSFLSALELDKTNNEAFVQLALLYEFTNDVEKLQDLSIEAGQNGASDDTRQLLKAMVCRRDKDWSEGLGALKNLPENFEPLRRYQLEGEFFDRLGNVEQAFAAFTRVNTEFLKQPNDPQGRALRYQKEIIDELEIVDRSWYDSWTNINSNDEYSSPVFLIGFPRSGTTLLDTMLMGHQKIQVLEEQPTIRTVYNKIGDFNKLSNFDQDELRNYRHIYYETVREIINYNENKTLVDKFPLYLNRLPIIHRIFPHAKFILALRHPCDVVLSCFITSFHPNNAMANFMSIENTVKLYDLSFSYWKKCSEIMPLNMHRVRYEDIVVNTKSELNKVLDFLDLEWQDSAFNHQFTASKRERVGTASYAQVTEPIYGRAVERWKRYADKLEPFFPILRPWVEYFGYSLE